MTPPTIPNKKFWNISLSNDGSSASIDISGEIIEEKPRNWFGDVIEGNYYTAEDFKNDLAAVKDCKEVTVNINSPGGDIYSGLAIHNALKALPCKVKTVAVGLAASAASVIFCAGDEREVFHGSLVMVHGVSVFLFDGGFFNEHAIDEKISDLRATRKAIQAMNLAVASIYANTTGKTQDECLSLISEGSELWMTGEQAIDRGFATGYVDAESDAEPLRLVACAGTGKTSLYSGSLLLSQDFHAPQNASELGFIPSETAPIAEQESPKPNNTIDTENTPTPEPVEETPAPAPVDTAAIAAQARAEERARIATITAQAEKLGSRVDKSLVNLAINGDTEHEPMTPEAFALAAINALAPEDKQPTAFLAAREQELAASDNVATAAPPAVDAAPKNHGLEVIDRLEKEEAAQRK